MKIPFDHFFAWTTVSSECVGDAARTDIILPKAAGEIPKIEIIDVILPDFGFDSLGFHLDRHPQSDRLDL